DVILRETVVVGLVGTTGLGSALLESLSAFAWEPLVALVAVYGALTLLGEELTDRLRQGLLAPPAPSAETSAEPPGAMAPVEALPES
ncbi:MAG: hypothetical protein ACK59A_03405, partial [Cyanobacteriota bacterium]